ncbi:serine/threonine protein kinase [Fischerella thermalis CCMEE 5319]|nr:serine/threonine protein kinase [Fischerella thermalis CCMEE 5319]
MIGKLLDRRYQVVQILGQGGFGHTYIAEDTRRPGNPSCVVKHLQPATSDPDFLETARRLFKREAETLEKLGIYDQIPRLLAYFEEDEEFYLVQEFVPGNPLSMELQPGVKWSESQVIHLLQDVLPILEFVHSHEVIHQDLKPHNLIRRSSDNKLVLVDFGAVKQVKMYSLMTPDQLKNETIPIGTPGYMPSEQALGRPYPNSDIYALGMIAIQALTGLHPKQLGEEPATGEIIWQHHAQVSDALAAILTKMVRQHYKYRYHSATDVRQAVAAISSPNTPSVVAAVVNQILKDYWQQGYLSATKMVRSLQELAKPCYVPPDNTTVHLSTGSTPTIPPTIPQTQNLGKTARLNPFASRNNFQIKRRQLPLLIFGTGAATLLTYGVITTSRPPQPTPVVAKNQVKETTDKNQTPKKDSCIIVVSSSNLRSTSGRRRTGKVIKAGTKVTVTGKEQNGWIEISSPESGWIWKSRTRNMCSGK